MRIGLMKGIMLEQQHHLREVCKGQGKTVELYFSAKNKTSTVWEMAMVRCT